MSSSKYDPQMRWSFEIEITGMPRYVIDLLKLRRRIKDVLKELGLGQPGCYVNEIRQFPTWKVAFTGSPHPPSSIEAGLKTRLYGIGFWFKLAVRGEEFKVKKVPEHEISVADINKFNEERKAGSAGRKR